MVGKPSLTRLETFRTWIEAVDGAERHVALQPQGISTVSGRVVEDACAAAHNGVLRDLVGEAEVEARTFSYT